MTPDELYYQTAKDTILYQSALAVEFSSRAFNLLNLSLAVLVAVGLILNFRLDDLKRMPELLELTVLAVAAIVAFLVVLWHCLSILTTRDWYAFPPLSEVRTRSGKLLEDETDELSRALADYIEDGAKKNELTLHNKANDIRVVVVSLSLEILFAICVVFLVFRGGV